MLLLLASPTGLTGANKVWQPLCETRAWGLPAHDDKFGPPPDAKHSPASQAHLLWCKAFAAQQRRLCVECGRPSRYVFKLLGLRMCTDCEHTVGMIGIKGKVHGPRSEACAEAAHLCKTLANTLKPSSHFTTGRGVHLHDRTFHDADGNPGMR